MECKTVVIEWRKPGTKLEKQCWGITEDFGSVNKIYIDKKVNGTPKAVDVFFHEMTHVFLNFHSNRKISKLSRKKEEALADAIGNAAKKILC